MLQQALDFRDESESLYELLAPLAEADFSRHTLFKSWSIDAVVRHLHWLNRAADLALTDATAFVQFKAELLESAANGTLKSFEDKWVEGMHGKVLLQAWRRFYLLTAEHFVSADPKQRVQWAGPDMSVLSSITARLMETWAHAQAVYDLLGVERHDQDRIRNIAQLGINTFPWSFKNRQIEPPGPTPQVRLTAPSGAVWEWNPDNRNDAIAGTAVEFCQVVCQTRNVADTGLSIRGPVATQWLAIAQCFAGPPENPPAPGSRHLSHQPRGESQ
jgi:uncharacterized protein (TIGR03084 family)